MQGNVDHNYENMLVLDLEDPKYTQETTRSTKRTQERTQKMQTKSKEPRKEVIKEAIEKIKGNQGGEFHIYKDPQVTNEVCNFLQNFILFFIF